MKYRLFIRVDGNSEIGLGHLIRCTALAQMLQDSFEISFCCKSIPIKSKVEIQNLNFVLTDLYSEIDFFSLISKNDIVLLDGYHFDINYQKRVKEIGCKLVCIDDIHDKPFVSDLIINHAPGVKPEDYQALPNTAYALGPEYSLLRPSFLKQAKLERSINTIKSIIICFGGADPKNLTIRALSTIAQNNFFQKIIVVTGPAFLGLDSLDSMKDLNEGRIEHYHAIGDKEMLDLMLKADVAIVPASGILYEALAVGCLVVSGFYAENQKVLYQRFKERNCFIDAGDFSTENINLALSKTAQAITNKKNIIDGDAPERLKKIFMDLMSYSIREANENDSTLLFNWANDPTVRSNSINQNEIEWESHKKWFDNKIRSPYTRFFILEKDNIPVGQIRYDKEGENWVIGFSIDKSYRGQGLGQKIVALSLKYFNGETIHANVKTSNEASNKVFKSLGFEQIDQIRIDQNLYYVYKKTINEGY